MLEWSFQVTKIDVAKVGRDRIVNALQYAGQAWQTAMRKYPPEVTEGTYARTMNLAKQVRYQVTVQNGQYKCDLLGPFYANYLLLGTGIYGPKQAPIVGNMNWKATKGAMAGKWIHANSIKGTIWPGKLDEVKQAVKDGFMVGLRKGQA